MTRTYRVDVSNLFEADSPEDAIKQMAAWLVEGSYTAGYRVWLEHDWPNGPSHFIDAEELDWND